MQAISTAYAATEASVQACTEMSQKEDYLHTIVAQRTSPLVALCLHAHTLRSRSDNSVGPDPGFGWDSSIYVLRERLKVDAVDGACL